MELVHILQATTMSCYDALSQSVMNLAAKQAKAGLHTKVWFVTDNPHLDYALANYEISLFPRLLNPWAIDTQLTEAIQCTKPNTVFHLHGEFSAFNYVVAKTLHAANKPFIFTFFPQCTSSQIDKANKILQKTLFQKKIIKLASVIHGFAANQMPSAINKSKIIPHGFEVSQTMQSMRSNDKFICSYNLTNCSNPHLLNIIAKSFNYFLLQNPNTELWILDKSKQIRAFEKIIKTHNIQNNVIFWNEQAASERSKLLSYSHLYLALSELAWPSIAIEAAALGVPVVVPNNTLLQQPVQDYEAGWVLSSINEASLLEALSMLHKQIQRQGVAIMGAQAQLMVREAYDWNKILPLYYQIYSTI
ncbi:Glycosyltransferase involved in cell wall bisynthesis [Flexibacter flexilis DSM 6793]|uniref:Glycosyltransferase involved in cell wall bisynthesis n=1 Tax=Flexibacter flexilis DSM 6793 TaxID=927664 RepID=A0A1I1DXQ4_9BACT|nr:glycosyltransferase [Flexibacter flexilis]SFB79587.1 Glycosyltransferase involved in cell wall bisynthesis [Flexibacter flexilis DSM 6793]